MGGDHDPTPNAETTPRGPSASVRIIGWDGPWAFLVDSRPRPDEPTTIHLHLTARSSLRTLLGVDAPEDHAVAFTTRGSLALRNGVLRRRNGNGVEIVGRRAPGPGYNRKSVGRIPGADAPPSVRVRYVAGFRIGWEEETPGLSTEALAAIAAWRSRQCCDVDGCPLLLPPGMGVCDDHLARVRFGALNRIALIGRRADAGDDREAWLYGERAWGGRHTTPGERRHANGATYSSTPCVACGGVDYVHRTIQGHPMGPGTIDQAICLTCDRSYSIKGAGRRGRGADRGHSTERRASVDALVRDYWRPEGSADHRNLTLDAPSPWFVLGRGALVPPPAVAEERRWAEVLAAAVAAVDEARVLALQPQDRGDPDVTDEDRCRTCGWPFGTSHRWSGGPSCAVLRARTHLSNGEWIRLPRTGTGLRALIAQWPRTISGPIAFGSSTKYGLGFTEGTLLRPVISGETAAVTMARVVLHRLEHDCPLAESLKDLLREARA